MTATALSADTASPLTAQTAPELICRVPFNNERRDALSGLFGEEGWIWYERLPQAKWERFERVATVELLLGL